MKGALQRCPCNGNYKKRFNFGQEKNSKEGVILNGFWFFWPGWIGFLSRDMVAIWLFIKIPSFRMS
jgi:hypothetical protein